MLYTVYIQLVDQFGDLGSFFTGLGKDNPTAVLNVTNPGVDTVAGNSKINIHWIIFTYNC